MNRSTFSLILLFLVLGAALAAAQEGEPPRLEFAFGPRVGVTYVMASPQEFNDAVQEIFPDGSRDYIPIFTQFGLNFEQRVRLGDTSSHFAFQEVLLLGGVDQNFYLPSLSVLIGFRSRAGLEFGLGPNLSLTSRLGNPGNVELKLAVVFSGGWTFMFSNVFVPVDLAFVPSPEGSRLTLLTGFNFKKR
jgi:hypothetical protein